MREAVEHYYGTVLQSSSDLRTTACTTSAAPTTAMRALIDNVHPEVRERYFGCGLVYPGALEACRALDLGCGSGRDCYVLSQLVGADGAVVGVDMTDEQLAIAERHRDWHAERFGFAAGNVSFRKGYIEQLEALDLEPGSFDVIVSNCVINLSVDKAAVLRGAHRLLKPGGELYFSDVYASRRVPAGLAADPVLYGECLGGALYWNDFHNLARACGFGDPRLVEDSPIAVTDPAIAARVGDIEFFSATYRLFKLDELEPACEDYGQAVVYHGTVGEQPSTFLLDKHHHIERGRVFPVCGNTWRMLHDTRFAAHFDFIGDFSTHFGIFEGCGSSLPYERATGGSAPLAASCC
ncbi:MAG: methyltransferase domain-containing protein [Gammaproteobacteria bacterium]|nr:methyltransferase domain-containing protein [Gammaproteobacteria bacterium]